MLFRINSIFLFYKRNLSYFEANGYIQHIHVGYLYFNQYTKYIAVARYELLNFLILQVKSD